VDLLDAQPAPLSSVRIVCKELTGARTAIRFVAGFVRISSLNRSPPAASRSSHARGAIAVTRMSSFPARSWNRTPCFANAVTICVNSRERGSVTMNE
jgi:hypothetical protein